MNTKTKVSHDYKCDGCDGVAVYNLQDWWHLYTISDKGSFKEIKDWEADNNEFWCEECFENEFE